MTGRKKLIELLSQNTCPSPMFCSDNCKYVNSSDCAAERLADYLLANGVIVPPVKVGDPVFRIHTWNGEHIVEGKISMIKQKADLSWKFRGIGRYFEGSCDYTIADIGTTIFLTRGDAEKALKERENNV